MFKFRFEALPESNDVRVTLIAQYPFQSPMYLGTATSEGNDVADVRGTVLELTETYNAQVGALYSKWEANGDYA